MKKILLSLLLFFLLALGIYSSLDNPSASGTATPSLMKDEGNVNVYFCPRENCENVLLDTVSSAQESLHCALFDIGLSSLKKKLLEKSQEIEVKVVTDNDYIHKFNHSFVKEDSSGLMHDKFCIIDGKKIFTGSMNPTENGVGKNNNNFLVISSKVLADNYDDEFIEMWNGTFKKGGKVLNPSVNLEGIKIQNYFCPEDSCAFHVKEELKKAQESIHFMTFSFTHEGIANVLLLKNLDGLDIKGVMEARQASKYSQFTRLVNNGIDVIKDSNKNNMHHKVFIIDGKTVITGSFNPTGNGDKGNDENVLIIGDEEIARLFEEEFQRIYAEARGST